MFYFCELLILLFPLPEPQCNGFDVGSIVDDLLDEKFIVKIPKVVDGGVIAGAEDRKLFVGGLSWETKEVQLKD